MTELSSDLEALSTEKRRFDPPAALAAAANVTAQAYELANADRLAFWETQAARLQWERPWDQVLDWQPPFAKWFVGGRLNASVNCLDRHVANGLGDRVAFHWVGEPEGDTRDLTYAQLLVEVSRCAHALTELGIAPTAVEQIVPTYLRRFRPGGGRRELPEAA